VFEQQYDDEMAAEIRRLEAKARAAAAGHPEWQNACPGCGSELSVSADSCERCNPET
jgi:predicted amidophosphoribosyltransferase